jgi:hypothetical protein
MSAPIEILAAIAVIAYVIGRQLTGEPLRGKRVVVLPVILTVIGAVDLGGSEHPVRPVDAVLLLVGAVVVAAIGLAQGAVMRLERRNGTLWGQMPVASLWLWLALVASRLMLTLLAVGLDAKAASAGSTILLMLGINRLGQAAVIVLRAVTSRIPFAPEKDGTSFLANLTGPPASQTNQTSQRL